MTARGMQVLVVSALAAGAAFLTPSIADAAVTLGQNAPAPASCGGFDYSEVQTHVVSGPGYSVPAGGGVITSWSAEGDADTDDVFRLRIFHPTGTPHEYRIVADSADQAITPNVLNTFPARIPVHAGDIIGIRVVAGSNPSCIFDETTNPGDTSDEIIPDDGTVGDTETAGSPDNEWRANISAKLEPDADGDGFGDETQDACPTDRNRQTACRADLSLTRRVSATAIATVGDLVTYTTTVSNFGPDTAKGVSVTDALPAGMAFVSALGGNCVLATCAIGDLGQRDTATVTVVARAIAAGTQSDTATATSSTADPNPANNSVTTALLVHPPFTGVGLRRQTVKPDRHGRIKLAVTCPASSSVGICIGADTLWTAGKGRSRKLGHTKFSIPAGKTRKVTIKLSKLALAMLDTKHTLRAKQTARAHDWRHGSKNRSGRVTLKARR